MQQPKPILMTTKGLEKLQEEKRKLLDERPSVVEDLKKAREMGDLSENGYYKSARFKLSSIDFRLRHVIHIIRYAKVQEQHVDNTISLGTTVHLENEGKEIAYMIVGEHEANPEEKKISHLSPLGSSLMNRKTGDSVTVHTPSGQKTHKITLIT